MTTEELKPIRWEKPNTATPPEAEVVVRSFSSMLARTQTPTKNEKQIGEQVRLHLAQEIGTAIKADHGQYLARKLSVNTVNHMDTYMTEEREILERERPAQDQADLEAFCHIVREGAGNSFLAIRQAAVNQIETIVITPLEISEEDTDEVIITQQPNIFQRIFGGGPQITQVKR